MRPRVPMIVLAACLSLLGTQLSGLHLHVGTDGFDSTPHVAHVHGAAAEAAAHVGHNGPKGSLHDHGSGGTPTDQDHDHAGDRDVSVTELGAGVSKLLVFLVWLGVGLLWVLQPTRRIRPIAILRSPKSRRERWRPPLRAPPSFSH